MKKISLALLIILLAVLAFFLVWTFMFKPTPPNVILISIDTLRADHLGCYGYERDTSPHLDRFAEEGILFENHFAPSSVTTPSHVSMLTSLYPLAHGVLMNTDPYSYSEDIVPISRILKEKGFKTAGFAGGAGVSEIRGFNRGFDHWSENRDIAPHLPDVMDWLRFNKEEKFFLFFHFYDVHSPYIFREKFTDMYRNLDYYEEFLQRKEEILKSDKLSLELYNSLSTQEKFVALVASSLGSVELQEPGLLLTVEKDIWNHLKEWPALPEYKDQVQLMIDSYDAGIKYTDFYLEEFFGFLKAQEIWDDTLIIVTSDHGEEFMEHAMVRHGVTLYDTLIHIPMIIKMPRSSRIVPRRISQLSELVDIMPTILDVLGISFKGQMQGQSLIPLMSDTTKYIKNSVFASLDSRKNKKKRMVRTLQWKYMIFDMDFSQQDEFFNIKEDRIEQNNLLSTEDKQQQELKAHLIDHIRECMSIYNLKYSENRKSDRSYPESLRKKHLDNLRALGYIH